MELPGLNPLLAAGANAAPAKRDQALANTDQSVRKVSEEFESVFLFEVLNSMYSGLDTTGLFGGGTSEKMFRSMLNEEVAKSISRAGGIGISDAIYNEIIRLQEINS